MESVKPQANTPGRGRTDWAGSGAPRRRPDLRALLWSFVVPPRGYRAMPTASGWILILVSLSLGLAAYNTSGNTLFMALALLLSMLILSGMLAEGNLRRCRWRLTPALRFRAGEAAQCSIEIANDKRLLPSCAITFDIGIAGMDANAIVSLATRLDARSSIELPFVITPPKRGVGNLSIIRARSLFPFGFRLKVVPGDASAQVNVWPARLVYERTQVLLPSRTADTGRIQRPGSGQDLLSLRPYRDGDPQRAIHWKATARHRRLLVRQFAAEASTGYRVRVSAFAEIWKSGPDFERLCSFAGSLIEDLFLEGRLQAVSIGECGWRAVQRLSDLEAVLDELAALQPVPSAGRREPPHGPNTLTFEPAAAGRIHAHVDSRIAATA